ncbi:MAG: hypothetical protein RL095_2102 [Verrucomicrobiota bacterium]|jgi:hypothetical protein
MSLLFSLLVVAAEPAPLPDFPKVLPADFPRQPSYNLRGEGDLYRGTRIGFTYPDPVRNAEFFRQAIAFKLEARYEPVFVALKIDSRRRQEILPAILDHELALTLAALERYTIMRLPLRQWPKSPAFEIEEERFRSFYKAEAERLRQRLGNLAPEFVSRWRQHQILTRISQQEEDKSIGISDPAWLRLAQITGEAAEKAQGQQKVFFQELNDRLTAANFTDAEKRKLAKFLKPKEEPKSDPNQKGFVLMRIEGQEALYYACNRLEISAYGTGYDPEIELYPRHQEAQ